MTTDELEGLFGTHVAAYTALGFSQQRYSNWKGVGIPCDVQIDIEEALNGKLRAGRQIPDATHMLAAARKKKGKK